MIQQSSESKDSFLKDKGLIENIRIIAEFIVYIEKYNKTEMFEILKSSLVLDTITQILKLSNSLKVKQQILQTINILIQNIVTKDRLRKFIIIIYQANLNTLLHKIYI